MSGRGGGIPPWRIAVRFVRQDVWVGVFWKRHHPMGDQGQELGEMLHVYVCLLPCLPIIVSRWTPGMP